MTSSDFRYCYNEVTRIYESSGESSLDALKNLVDGLGSVSGIVASINITMSEGEYFATAYVVA